MKHNAQTDENSPAASCFRKKARVAREQSVGAAVRRRIPRRRGEDAEQNDAEEAADAVHAPHVERIVPAQLVLQRAGVVADDARDDADDDGRRRARRSRPPA